MEVSTEISQKIRSAIKAKLMELGAYVDDELPDYIMVMVANKKSRSQMSNDLGLFLGTNTDTFTGWLHGLLGKLQTITSESNDKSKAKTSKDKKKEKKDGKEKKKSKKHGDPSVSKKKLEITETSNIGVNQLIVSETTKEITHSNDSILTKNSSDGIIPDENKTVVTTEIQLNDEVEDVRQLLVTGAQADELAEELETTEEEVSKSLPASAKLLKPDVLVLVSTKDKDVRIHRKASRSRSSTPPTDAVSNQLLTSNRKRKIPTSVVASVSRTSDNEEEYDPYNPAVGSVASVVKVTSRRSSVPVSLQANRDSVFEDVPDIDQPPAKILRIPEAVSLTDIQKVVEDAIKRSQENSDDIAGFSKTVDSALRKIKAQHIPLAKLKIQEILFEFETLENVNNTITTIGQLESKEYSNAASKRIGETIDKNNYGLICASSLDETKTSSKLHSSKTKSIASKHFQLQIEPHKKPETMNTIELAVQSVEQASHVCKQLKTVAVTSERHSTENIIPQSPVSSSKIDTNSPNLFNSCPPSSTSGSDWLALRRCIVSTSTQSPLIPRDNRQAESGQSAGMDQSTSPITVDSIHFKRRSKLTEHVTVLRHSLNKTKGLQECEEETPRINPEALKVLAKNLKVTVINKKAAQTLNQSSSDSSSSYESDEEESSGDEEVSDLPQKDASKKLNKEISNNKTV